MPKLPVTISIVPSNIAMTCHGLLAVSVLALVGFYGSSWLIALTFALGVIALALAWDQRQYYSLRWLAWGKDKNRKPAGQWQWRCQEALAWQDVSMRLTYLGPWLIGLRVDRQHYWLWPDSATSDALRQLRGHLLMLNAFKVE